MWSHVLAAGQPHASPAAGGDCGVCENRCLRLGVAVVGVESLLLLPAGPPAAAAAVLGEILCLPAARPCVGLLQLLPVINHKLCTCTERMSLARHELSAQTCCITVFVLWSQQRFR
jgi:hypothetical protein